MSLTIQSIRAKKARFLLTSIAVVLGVAFMAGTFVLTDTIAKSYDTVTRTAYESTDAVVRSARHVQGANDAAEVRGTVDASVLERVRAVDAVGAAEPQLKGIAVVVGHDGELVDANPNRAIPVALGWPASRALNPMRVVAGHAPRRADEVVIDRATRRVGNFRLGEQVRVVGPSGAGHYRLVGVVTYGGADDAAGAQLVAFAPATASEVFGTSGRYAAINVVAADGVSPRELVANLSAALPEKSLDVVTGTVAAEEAREEAGTALGFVSMFLLVFAIVALVVGSFVIHNTFAITVAQRTRETALLRAIGARRTQVTRSVMLEAFLTGLFASAVGVVAGIGTAHVLRWALAAFGVSFPSAGTVVAPRTIVVSMAVGIVVTLVSAYFPARRAAKTAPIEALRDAATDHDQGARRRTVVGALVTAGGAALIAQGLSGGGAGPVGLGALAVFVGVAMLGPVLARPFVRTVGWPVARGSVAGALARENANRNPRRTSATASSLMVGVGLVVLITIFAASTRASLSTTVEEAMKGEFIIDTQFGMGGLSPTAAQQIDALPETASVTQLRYATATARGTTKAITGFDPTTIADTVFTDLREGSLSGFGAREVAVQEREAEARGLGVGDTVTLSFPETGPQEFRVGAVFGTREPLGQYAISLAAYEANVTSRVDDNVVIATAPGVSMSEARHAIEAVLADYPTAELLSEEQFKSSFASEINKTLNLVYVLLAMALVIAFFGIANTLALSVFERTRELGVLRALGMTRTQVRSMVRRESVLIALLGTTLGTLVGAAFSWALVRALRDEGFSRLVLPAPSLVAIVVLAALAAVLVAAPPARRAANLDVLEAIQR
ncbi:MAG: ABC transporter substrate-binding protein [Acidimicrobiia bacterium]